VHRQCRLSVSLLQHGRDSRHGGVKNGYVQVQYVWSRNKRKGRVHHDDNSRKA
jgi:hypothetical protein